MYISLITFSLSIFFAYIAKYSKFDWCLKFSFLILFVFLILRFDFGNDYLNYLFAFQDINKYGFSSRVFIELEPGYIFLNKLSPNFFILVFVISLFYLTTFYYFIKNNISPNYYWFAIFIFTFYPTIFLVNLSGLRQTIAMVFFILGIMLFNKGHRWVLIIFILIGSLFHYSCLLLLPLFAINKNILNSKYIKTILIIFTCLCFLLSPFIVDITNNIIILNNELNTRYDVYLNTNIRSFSITNFLTRIAIIVFLIFTYKSINENLKLYTFLAIIYMSFSLIGFYSNSLDRFFSYLAPFLIIALPTCIQSVKSKLRIIIIFFFIALYINYTIDFLNSDVWSKKYKTYKTIFSNEAYYVFNKK
jgi:hypothetical protein